MTRRAIVLLAVVLAGCGIPLDSAPEPVTIELGPANHEDVPILGNLAAVSIYLVRGESLVQVTRDLPTPASPETIFDSLLDSVTEPEQRAGLRTAIPPDTTAIGITEGGTTLHVDLSREFATVGGDEEILAVAQIVMTATSLEGIESVSFALEGVPTDVPVADGALSVDPVGAEDYASLVGR